MDRGAWQAPVHRVAKSWPRQTSNNRKQREVTKSCRGQRCPPLFIACSVSVGTQIMAFPGDKANCAHFTDEGPEAQWDVSTALSEVRHRHGLFL